MAKHVSFCLAWISVGGTSETFVAEVSLSDDEGTDGWTSSLFVSGAGVRGVPVFKHVEEKLDAVTGCSICRK